LRGGGEKGVVKKGGEERKVMSEKSEKLEGREWKYWNTKPRRA